MGYQADCKINLCILLLGICLAEVSEDMHKDVGLDQGMGCDQYKNC